ncbi:hypothetical protein EBZ38_03485 [bacterium]|nr:hypothetical protein [bacterium]NDC94025.1 hypothetical protein [bacterium]NDD83330.1 hypothetical protein [bacterium]
MRAHRLIYGSLNEPVLAKIHVEEGFKNAYVAEAVFEETGEYLSETEVLLLEAQNADRIFDACTEHAEEEFDAENKREYKFLVAQGFTKKGL